MNILNNPTLMLNKSWVPIEVVPIQHAIVKVCAEQAKIIGYDFNVYDWEKWVETNKNFPTNDRVDLNNHEELYVKTPHGGHIRYISVVICDYKGTPKSNVKISINSLLKRENYKCAYTGEPIHLGNANIDHVIPTSRGGDNSWENVVACKKKINSQKDNKTPEEFGIKLKINPQKPNWNPIYSKIVKKEIPDFWKNFIK